MRAQISGLEQASNNVKDGISLVQTGEGALQEVQDMLNRMVTLAEQSANGTYQDDVDRDNLQSEMDALKEEINRIADSSNFNGINLLDGSLAGAGGDGATSVKDVINGAAVATVNATGGAKFKQTITVAKVATGKVGTIDLKYMDDDGNVKTASIEWTSTATSSSTSKAAAELQKYFDSEKYSVTGTATTITIEAKSNFATDTQALKITQTNDGATVAAANAKITAIATQGKDDAFTVALANADVTKGDYLEIDGQKYQIATRGATVADDAKALYVDKTTATLDADAVKQIVSQLQDYGVKATVNATTATSIDIAKGTASSSSSSGGLTLQIGDTSDNFNQMSVSIKDMHTTAMGIANLSVATQSDAASAISVIKDAINYVSSTRGDLGAIQNRLEHTSNNLSVMTENIQDAESSIRDTDIAEEMMSYTKNNILVQSAQAMLAQANTVPQGVLQLLQ
jgi:flagellin